MTIENSSRSITMKVCGRAGKELPTPGPAMGHATDCAMGAWLFVPSHEILVLKHKGQGHLTGTVYFYTLICV